MRAIWFSFSLDSLSISLSWTGDWLGDTMISNKEHNQKPKAHPIYENFTLNALDLFGYFSIYYDCRVVSS